MHQATYIVLLLLQSIPCLANFGLASLETRLTFTDPRHENSVLREKVLVIGGGGGGEGQEGSVKRTSENEICRRLGLHGWQKTVCLRGQEMADVLMEAVRLSVSHCQRQFLYERWNCSLDGYRQILKNDYRETSFLYAISSAGLVHAVSRACSLGQLDLCTCDDRSYHQQANKDAWKWGGCGDNLRFGRKFIRKFLRRNASSSSSSSHGTSLSPKTTKHNMEVGIKTVQEGFQSVCKCHGVSSSCTMKTCWKQLAHFHDTGTLLKKKYDSAIMVTENRANENRHLVTKSDDNTMTSSVAPRRNQLVYTQESPNFCARSKFSPGTKSRRCEKNLSCDVLCCGRGYNVELVTVRQRCNCEFKWCCVARCDVCTFQKELFTCK